MKRKSKGVSNLPIYKIIYKDGNEKIWGLFGNRRTIIPPESLDSIKALFKQDNIETYNYNDPIIDTLERVSDLSSERYIQSIALYKDKAVSEISGETILIGPSIELIAKNEHDEVSFIAAINLVNITETVTVSSAFSKLNNTLDYLDDIEVNRMEQPNRDYQNAKNMQVTFDVNAKLEGFGTYVFKTTITFENGYSEMHEILVPVVREEVD
ncbi:hypothetical protein [Enterococcus hailinensis]|uniref:hypothetical protein n=1 Tax=Enterococcus hailinensis TaxID=3238988 RepID=UPI0038B24747